MDFSKLHAIAHAERQSQKPVRIRCCTAAPCWSANSQAVKQELAEAIAENGFSEEVEVLGVGCMGLCSRGPLVQIDYRTDVHGSSPVLYENVTVAKVSSIVNTLDGGCVNVQQVALDHPFFTRQQPIVLENSGTIDPERIEAYLAVQGYQALHQVLAQMSPTDVVNAIARSGLRGRGGSGYPTGLKWATVAKATGARKFILCQTDQADPGAFLDRTILESDPHRILEGLAIAAYAVGADQGYIYIRPEYPLTISRLQLAIHQAQRLGLLGDQILGSPFNFHLDVRMGTGSHSIVETAALITRFEDLPDIPSPLPSDSTDWGLWGYPTLTNHVETIANIAPIIRKGAEWFASIGTETSKGTKVLALGGAVQYPGLIEVPMGTSLRHIVEVIGGGVPSGSTVKALQVSGPASGCIPASLIDTPIDYEALAALG
ncbi:MAG TPA: NAD(P)H-dependent oxidoreductase subunit E, partial [Chroococcidiopsis sp.]